MSRKEPIENRVATAAEAALTARTYVAPVDVLIGVGWLAPSHLDTWRQGRVDCLERLAQVDAEQMARALRHLDRWARGRGLTPSDTAYIARTRDRRRLRFSESGGADLERTYRTHWISPELPPKKRERLVERQSRPPDLVVIAATRDWTCAGCGDTESRLLMMDDAGPLCMDCVDLGHLAFLPSGNVALTRRAKKASRLSAVVVKFSGARKRYERQGILVEEAALERAEEQCLADEEVRKLRRLRDSQQRDEADVELRERLAAEIVRLFPACPQERAERIAWHTSVRGSGRIGRSAAGQALDGEAVTLAVAASVRHVDTDYDELLMSGVERETARAMVRDDVHKVLEGWRE